MAGILDLLDPSQGGLLGLLRASALNQAMPGGLPSDTADYGRPAPMSFAPPQIAPQPQPQLTNASDPIPSPLDNAQWPAGPVGAPSSANASMPAPTAAPAPQPIAAPQPAPSPGFGDRLTAAAQSMQNSRGILPALFNGVASLASGTRTDPEAITQNATARALLAKGADPAAIAAMAGNQDLQKALITQYYGPQTLTPLGNGYVADRNGKVTRAYEPEAKAPTSLGSGYIWNPETAKVERAYTPDDAKGATKEIRDREAAVTARGLDPKDPRNQQYILTGKFPREDAQPLTATDKKFIDEADDAVFTSRNVISALNTAKGLSKDANSGYFASTRATLGNNLPDSLVPDFISSPKSSEATTNYDNVVLGQTLGQLKTIFGAAPTEGERKILLDLQASADKPDKIRQEILDRAIVLAQRKLDYNQQRAAALRGGSFYKPGYNADGQGGQPPAAASAPATGPLQPGQSTTIDGVTIRRVN